MTSSEDFAEEVDEATGGAGLRSGAGRSGAARAGAQVALGQYFRESYGPHPAFELFCRESPAKLVGSEASSETGGSTK